MNIRNRRIRPRLGALALAAFGFATALSATAEVPRCDHCLGEYYGCRSAGGEYEACVNAFWDCETANGCAISLPPDF